MSRRVCSKKGTSLLWTLLECVFFSGIVLGWSWLSLIFRADHFLLQGCNVTDLTLDPFKASRVPSTTPSPPPPLYKLMKRPCRKKGVDRSRDENVVRVARHTPILGFLHQGSVHSVGDTSGGYLSGDDWAGTGRGSPGSVFSREGSAAVPGENSVNVLSSGGPGSKSREAYLNVIVDRDHRRVNRDLPLAFPLEKENHTNETSGESDGGDREEGEEEEEEEEGLCMEQREILRLLLAVAAVLRDLFVLPIGAFFDKFGTTRTRLISVLILATGTLLMTFTNRYVPWLMLPALALTGVAGVGVLLTNVQIANLFGRRRHVIMSLYCGASLSSGFITYMMQLSQTLGVDRQSSFMFLTIGLVPMLVSTVAFLPKTRIPWPLPAHYGKRRNQSLDENLLRKQRAWQRRLSEAGVVKLRRPTPEFWPRGSSQLFVGIVLWYGVQSLHSAQAETLVVDVGHWTDGLGSDLEHIFGWIQLLSTPLALLPGLLIDRRRPRELGVVLSTHHMQNMIPALVLTSLVGVAERVVLMAGRGVVACHVMSYVLHALHRVFHLVTGLAFLLHVHFAPEHTGKYVGLTLAVSAVISSFQFPLRIFLKDQPMVVHSVITSLLVLTLGHAFHVWSCCRRRLIRDHTDRAYDPLPRTQGHALLAVHVQTDDSNLPQEIDEQPGPSGTSSGTYGHGACPGTSGCCPGPSGEGGGHREGGAGESQHRGGSGCEDGGDPQGSGGSGGRSDEATEEVEAAGGPGRESGKGWSHDKAKGRGLRLEGESGGEEARDMLAVEDRSPVSDKRRGSNRSQGGGGRVDLLAVEDRSPVSDKRRGSNRSQGGVGGVDLLAVEDRSPVSDKRRGSNRSQGGGGGVDLLAVEDRSPVSDKRRGSNRSDKHRNGLHVVIREPDLKSFGIDS
ncbi:hypothetical protein V1264_022582 [Littorina saxatilis]|uniref:Uncharacterized protein n=1 Tax=Littorina saxatilis TaxID=31220 RepID=A0AAN9AKU7_9CAEN